MTLTAILTPADEGGCYFEFTNRGQPEEFNRKLIDKILNYSDRGVTSAVTQLKSAVIVRKNKEICRIESSARRKKIAALLAKDREFAP